MPARFAGGTPGQVFAVEDAALLLQASDHERGVGCAVRLVFEGAGTGAELVGEEQLSGLHNFFLGSDPDRWQTGLQAFGAVRIRRLKDGVDARVYGWGDGVKYDLLLDPGVDPAAVVVRCEGADSIALDDLGNLIIDTELGPLIQAPPNSWQVDEMGNRHPLASRCRIIDAQRFSFELDNVDDERATVIDPGLSWGTFLGSSVLDSDVRVALAHNGDILVAGTTDGSDFPVTPGAFDMTYNGNRDAYLCQFDATGSTLLFATYLGGSSTEYAVDIAASADDTVSILLLTNSLDIPTTRGAWDTRIGFSSDAYVARVGSAGSNLLWATYLGGSSGNGFDEPEAMILEGDGSCVIVGYTEAPDFPTTPGAFNSSLEARDVFITRLSADGSAVMQSTLLGGSATDLPLDATGAPDGSVVVVGLSQGGFPTSPGAYDDSGVGGFVTRLLPDLSGVVFSTMLDSNDPGEIDRNLAVAIDSTGAVTVAGYTFSSLWPVTPGAFDTRFAAFSEVFVTKLDATGSSLLFSTYIGGFGFENDVAMAIDSGGVVTLAGETNSQIALPITDGAFDTSWNGDFDGFVLRLAPDGSEVWYGTYLGGSGEEGGNGHGYFDVELTADGAAVIVGLTRSRDFPATVGSFDPSFNGIRDAFVAKLDMLPTGVEKVGTSSPGCTGELSSGVTRMPSVGDILGLTCTNAPPSSSQGVLVIGPSALAASVSVKGAALWVDPSPFVLLFPVSSDELGFSWVHGLLPASPGLVGAGFAVQFFWPDPCLPPGKYSASDALAITIQL